MARNRLKFPNPRVDNGYRILTMRQLIHTFRNCPPYMLAIAGTVAAATWGAVRLLSILRAHGLPQVPQ